MTDSNPSPTPKQTAIFLLSWLSNAASGSATTGVDPDAQLLENSRLAISNGLASNSALVTDTPLNQFFESLDNPASSIVWPLTIIDRSAQLKEIGYSVAANSMHVLKGKPMEGNAEIMYVIGVAGTNSVSPFDWFTEDMTVTGVQKWTDTLFSSPLPTPINGNDIVSTDAYISQGTAIGVYDLLNDPKMQCNGKQLLAFLLDEANDPSNEGKAIEIAVAGHSLGGALSPTLALAIKQFFQNQSLKNDTTVSVSAWPTAGPTPGNQGFANLLHTTLDDYVSIYNERDTVPHAWENGMLKKVCSLYTGLNPKPKFYVWNGGGEVKQDDIKATAIVNGLISWARSLPTMEFERATGDIVFAPETLDFNTVGFEGHPLVSYSALHDAAVLLNSSFMTTHRQLQDIQNACTKPDVIDIDNEVVFDFLTFMTEIGIQHVQAYLSRFLCGNNWDPQKPALVALHNCFGEQNAIATGLALAGLEELLRKTANFYTDQNGQCIQCQS